MVVGRVKIPPRPSPRSNAGKFSHSLLIWEQGETPNPKVFSVQAQASHQVRVQKTITTKPEMGIKIETVTEAKDYRITVTPKNTDQPGMALVTIEALVLDKPKLFTAYLQIKPKPRQ